MHLFLQLHLLSCPSHLLMAAFGDIDEDEAEVWITNSVHTISWGRNKKPSPQLKSGFKLKYRLKSPFDVKIVKFISLPH